MSPRCGANDVVTSVEQCNIFFVSPYNSTNVKDETIFRRPVPVFLFSAKIAAGPGERYWISYPSVRPPQFSREREFRVRPP